MSQKRNRRSGVEDLWTKEVRDADGTVRREPSKLHGRGKRWRGRYVDDLGDEHTKRHARKTDAQDWIDQQVAQLVQGTHVAPRDQQRTVEQWCAEWLTGYAKRENTVEAAEYHIKKINAEFGKLTLSQILGDAVEDNLLGRNPCSRKTSPPSGTQKVYVATTEQVWALYDAFPEYARVAVLLGAFVGLRISEACGLKVSRVDFVRGIVHTKVQWNEKDTKTGGSDAALPIPRELTLMFSASVKQFPGEHLLCDELGNPVPPWALGRIMRAAREQVPGLPEGFSFQDLRHYLASLLISKGADVKIVQARMRHASAITTLNTYAHLWPDSDESTRKAIAGVLKERMESTAYPLRTRRRGGRQS